MLAGVAEVIGTALREARALIAADAIEGRIGLNRQIEVEDELGLIIHKLPFERAVWVERDDYA